jgi:hypothetical protein
MIICTGSQIRAAWVKAVIPADVSLHSWQIAKPHFQPLQFWKRGLACSRQPKIASSFAIAPAPQKRIDDPASPLSQSLVRVGDYSSMWNVDFCRDSEEEGRNLQKTSVTDGFYWRCKERSGTVVEPISNPDLCPSVENRVAQMPARVSPLRKRAAIPCPWTRSH